MKWQWTTSTISADFIPWCADKNIIIICTNLTVKYSYKIHGIFSHLIHIQKGIQSYGNFVVLITMNRNVFKLWLELSQGKVLQTKVVMVVSLHHGISLVVSNLQNLVLWLLSPIRPTAAAMNQALVLQFHLCPADPGNQNKSDSKSQLTK